MCFKFGVRHQGRLFFPGLRDPPNPPTLSDEHFRQVYEKAVLPAVRQCSALLAEGWPANYQAVQNHARKAGGQFGSVTQLLPVDVLDRFARLLFLRLDRLGEDFRGAFFEIEVRGVKRTSMHDASNDESRQAALNEVLAPLNILRVSPEEQNSSWYIDVALEVHREGYAMQWLTGGHHHLLSHVLPSLQAERIQQVHRSSRFYEDLSGHLTDLAGFRLAPGAAGRRDKIVYISVYTTDKAITYQTSPGGMYRRRRYYDLFKKKREALIEAADNITITFADCGGRLGEVQDSSARIEVRVKFAHAFNTLRDLPNDLIQNTILPVPSDVWW